MKKGYAVGSILMIIGLIGILISLSHSGMLCNTSLENPHPMICYTNLILGGSPSQAYEPYVALLATLFGIIFGIGIGIIATVRIKIS